MRNRILTASIVLIGLALIAMPILAEGMGGSAGAKDEMRAGRGGGGGRGGMGRLIKSLDLEEEQKEPVRAAFKSHGEAVKTRRAESKELYKQLKAAYDAKDDEAIKAAREKLIAHRDGRKELADELMSDLEGTLSDEQMAKVREHFAKAGKGGGRRGKRMGRPGQHARMAAALDKLDLTDAQKTKIREIRQAAHKKIVEEVLTAEQREKLEKMREKRQERRDERKEGKEGKKGRGGWKGGKRGGWKGPKGGGGHD